MQIKLKPFGYLKLVALLTTFSLLVFQYSCKKQQDTITSSNNNNFVDISKLRPEMKVEISDVFNWIAANTPDAHKGSLQLNKIQQRFIDNHHVIKIPIQDDAALFFTKDSAKLKVYAYKWDDRDPGTKLYTGHIISFSFQDFSMRALQYYEGKKIKDGTLKSGSSFFSSKGNTPNTLNGAITTKGFLATSGEERVHTMSLLGDIWCILTGGTIFSSVGTAETECDYGNGWAANVMSFLANLFGSSNSDSSSYGNTPSSPTGVWYGSGAYTGSSPSQGGGGGNGTSPANQPFQSGPVWVSQWVDTTNPANCTTTDENGNMMFVPGGCSSGYWQSVQIDYDSLDTYTGDENDEPDDDNGNGITGPTAHIPSQITLDNGSVVNVVFGSTKDGSADQPVNIKVIATLKQALNIASAHVTINTIYIKATTNGSHSTPQSNHFRALAVDISRINGVPIVMQGASDLVKNLQLALDQSANIRENFGPFFLHKFGSDHNSAPAHKDHIHFSVNQ